MRAHAPDVDIVDVTEIAARAGTTPGTIHSWRVRHPDFPEPYRVLRIGPIWLWPPVRDWIDQRRASASR